MRSSPSSEAGADRIGAPHAPAPSISARSVRCWPGREAEGLAQLPAARRSATTIASRRLAPDLGDRSAGGMRIGFSGDSDALEVVERLAAGAAAPQRLAGGRAELGRSARVSRASRSAGRRRVSSPNSARRRARGAGRRDAVGAQLAAGPPRSSSRWSRPATAPSRPRAVDAALRAARASMSQRDHVHRRAAGIGRRDRRPRRAPSVDVAHRAATPRSASVSTGISGSHHGAGARPARGAQSGVRVRRHHHVAPG